MKTVASIGIRSRIASMAILISILVPISSWASVEVDGIYYDLNTSVRTASVTSNPNRYSGTISIPSTFVYSGKTYSVTSIGRTSFSGCTGLTSVTIPNSVTSIGEGAFMACTSLTAITIPNSVSSLGEGLFVGCTSLQSVKIGSSVTEISANAFQDCSRLKYVTMGSSVSSIGSSAFSGCTGLNSIEIPNSVTSIDSYAFSDCKGLTSIEIPNSVTFIGGRAFQNCSALSTIGIPNSVTSILSSTFSGCSNLTTVSMPNHSVTSIGSAAFGSCTSLVSLEIPNSVTSLESSVFSGCTSLTSLKLKSEIPPSITQNTFYGFDQSACTLYVPGSTKWESLAGWMGFKEIVDYELVPDILDTGSFGNNLSYTIYSDMSMVVSGSGAMLHYPYVTPRNNDYYQSIRTVVIEEGVTSIGYSAFSDYASLTSVTIPSSVTSIGSSAFSGCTGLTSIEIPSSVTSIGDHAFDNCTSLTSIEIPNSVTSIDEYAFYRCTGLTSVLIGNGVKSIGESAFSDCTSLTSVTIGNSVTYIYDYAFSYCNSLSSITIPSSVSYIAHYAFAYCPGLTSIIVEDGNSYFDSRDNCNAIILTPSNKMMVGCKNTVIPNSVTWISEAFKGCTGLTSIEIPNSVTRLDGTFGGCTGLTSVVIPNSVTELGWEVFDGCTNLKSLTIPNSVTSIGPHAFRDCWLQSLTVERESPPSLGYEDDWEEVEFFFDFYSNSVLYVPEGCKEIYESREGWNKFPNIVEYKVEPEIEILATGSCGDNVAYTIYPDMTMAISGTGDMQDYSNDEHINDNYYQSIQKVIIEDGVTSIGGGAFSGCTALTSVEIPNSVTEIGLEAFLNCTGLTSLDIPNSVTRIVEGAFYGCTGLTSVEIPNGITYIDDYTFSDCTGLTSITLPNSVTKIGSCAFARCTSLNSVEIPNSVTVIEDGAFVRCIGLTSIDIPNSVIEIGEEAFESCTALNSITVDWKTPLVIPSSVFDNVDKTGCMLYVPYGSKSAYDSAEGWSAFQNIKEYFNADGLEILATGSCGTNVTYTIYSDMTMVITGTGPIKNYYNSPNGINDDYYSSIKNVIIEEGVTSIGFRAFLGYTSLTSIIMPNSLTEIWDNAFWNCIGLTSVTIPNSVKSISEHAFNSCTGLTSIAIPSSVTSIDGDAFSGCTGLTSITVGWETPLTISSIVFYNVDKTSCTLYVPFGTKSAYESAEVWGEFENIKEYFNADGLDILATGECGADGDNVTYTIYSDMTMVISGTGEMHDYGSDAHINDEYYQAIENVIIEEGVTSIGGYAFYGCKGLTSIALPSSVTSIGWGAFCSCMGLTSIEIPSSVTSIGLDTFGGCTGLSSIVIPSSVTSIGEAAFDGCTGLTSIALPSSLTSIGEVAFWGCTGLTSIEIPSSVTSIGEGAFWGCTGLTSILVEEGNTTYDSRNNCNAIIKTSTNLLIQGCQNSFIPSGVTSIDEGAFSGCKGLTSIAIPSSVTSIYYEAFSGCTGLTSITVGWETPLSISPSVFSDDIIPTCTLYVPYGTKPAYESADVWKEFRNIVEYGEEPDTDLSVLANAIYVNQTEGRIGGTMDIPVNIKSSYPVRGFQFAMELPEGAIINSWALSTDRLPSGATTSDKIAAQNITGNKITVACSLNYGTAAFTGNDGVVATINVTFPDDMEPGSYPIYLTACDVNDASGKDEDLSDVKATLVLEDYLPGDANGDGKVRIGDATTILNYIVGTVSEGFNVKAADANGDGKIRIGDATSVLNIIVNQ